MCIHTHMYMYIYIYYIISYHTILYCIILYYIILYCIIILYYIIFTMKMENFLYINVWWASSLWCSATKWHISDERFRRDSRNHASTRDPSNSTDSWGLLSCHQPGCNIHVPLRVCRPSSLYSSCKLRRGKPTICLFVDQNTMAFPQRCWPGTVPTSPPRTWCKWLVECFIDGAADGHLQDDEASLVGLLRPRPLGHGRGLWWFLVAMSHDINIKW